MPVGQDGCTRLRAAVTYFQELTQTVDNMVDQTGVRSPFKQGSNFHIIYPFSQAASNLEQSSKPDRHTDIRFVGGVKGMMARPIPCPTCAGYNSNQILLC